LITPEALEPEAFAYALDGVLGAGDVACLQLRLKGPSDAEILRAAAEIKPVCVRNGVAFILNDRPDLAAKVEAEGVHVGQEDVSYAEARRIIGPDRIVGVTCHASRDLAIEAADAGADYVAFGAFFPSGTKAAKTRADLEILRWWSELMTVPCVAIGGIMVENCAPLVEAGADFIAVAGGVWSYPKGPVQAVADFNTEIAHASRKR
jgi:thiamine-phosphate pyrophosphorylase